MTYKRADRPEWRRLRGQRFVCQRVRDAHVTGYATLVHMVEVTEPLWVSHHEQRICIADSGYSWLQIFPEGAHYTHTTMFDADGQPIQEYIDLVAEQGVGEDGIPWYDDLYLDITWIPGGTPLLLDQEELEAAYAIGAITQEQYDLARGETARLLVALTLGDYPLPEITRACYPTLRAALDDLESPSETASETAPAPAEAAEDAAAAIPAIEVASETPDNVAITETPETPELPETPETPAKPDAGETPSAEATEPAEPAESAEPLEVTQAVVETPAMKTATAALTTAPAAAQNVEQATERGEHTGEDEEQRA